MIPLMNELQLGFVEMETADFKNKPELSNKLKQLSRINAMIEESLQNYAQACRLDD